MADESSIIEVTYFKSSGKYYTSSFFRLPHRKVPPVAVVAYFKAINPPPGLSGGPWRGHVLLSSKAGDGFVPRLIVASEDEEAFNG